jgi:hypothetical protein
VRKWSEKNTKKRQIPKYSRFTKAPKNGNNGGFKKDKTIFITLRSRVQLPSSLQKTNP